MIIGKEKEPNDLQKTEYERYRYANFSVTPIGLKRDSSFFVTKSPKW